MSGMKLFTGNAHPDLAARVADHLEISLGRLTSTKFSDGEIRVMVDESARGNDVFVVQPTCAPANDTLVELLVMLDAFKRASAQGITVVMPYYGYARQDKKIKPREPITARLVADLISVAGATRIVTVDLHAEQIQGFFNMPVDHLYGGPILGRYMIEQGFADEDLAVVSPDVAGVARAKALAEMLGKPFVVIAKRRPEPNKAEVVEIIGNFKGKKCVIIDDMIDTAGSIVSGAEALLERGAKSVVASCTHPVLSSNAAQRLQDSVISQIICLDTIPIPSAKSIPKLTVLPSAPLIAEAIRRIHLNESVSELFHDWR
ncbi:MAG: ribose-phosphate pyrophosphokinase [Fimbriimonas ginsengisoli]|uniref:Ribose-phosphate pyrophosphokinase n=1 Tax=Fimbriimonas ginsengisoli TaxID=1005039 RepID=A0A931PSJ7_FIMGI|nr:ribose-phosphate pyrophosphokinase [Fimbriimonas ginsengisoli]